MKKIPLHFYFLGVLTAFFLHNGLSCPDKSPTEPETAPQSNVDIAKINDGAKTAESNFKTGDPQKVISVMTKEAASIYGAAISKLNQSQLKNLGQAIEKRELSTYTDLYAEYTYTKDGISFTMAFARQSDGSWKLMRF